MYNPRRESLVLSLFTAHALPNYYYSLWIYRVSSLASSTTTSSSTGTIHCIVDLKEGDFVILCVLGKQVMSLKYGSFVQRTRIVPTILN